MKQKHVFAVCAYGDSPYLENCLRSLKGQTVPTHVILCTSTPSPYLEEVADKYQIPLYVRQGESGIGQDWNFAWSKAQGEWVTIAHQDDVYRKNYVESLFLALRKWPDMSLFTSDYVIIKNGRLVIGDRLLWTKRFLRIPLRFPPLNHIAAVKLLPLMFGNPICCPATSYRKGTVGDILVRPDWKFALDWDSLVRLAGKRGRFICWETPLFFYRVHEEATTKACIQDQSRMREEEEMFSRFWPKPLVRLLMGGYRKAYEEYQQ